ncbi:MAG: hypothetical protein A4E49_00844 [Methanosaeta sp. PtaU1.Bin112]|nr:MAG: hypothetical protein A4E49_00844 [Methanosaeta sp. PtaU1.Bin112]
MLNAKNATLLLIAMTIALAFNASAQWSPGGSMVYMGDLNLALSSFSAEKSVQAASVLPAQAIANNTTVNATSTQGANATGPNGSLLPADSEIGQNDPAVPSPAAGSSGKKVLDLSGYSRDRVNRNLAGYTNIMYPISGSRGSTTSTAGGGGCGGGCS